MSAWERSELQLEVHCVGRCGSVNHTSNNIDVFITKANFDHNAPVTGRVANHRLDYATAPHRMFFRQWFSAGAGPTPYNSSDPNQNGITVERRHHDHLNYDAAKGLGENHLIFLK